MQAVEGVDIFQSVSHLLYVANSLGFRQRSVVLDHVSERLPLYEVHRVVSRSVLLEHVRHAHYVRMVHVGDSLRLLKELSPELLQQLRLRLCGEAYLASQRVAVAVVADEELLQSHFSLKHHVLRLIRAAEASAADEAHNPVLPALQESAVLKIHFSFCHVSSLSFRVLIRIRVHSIIDSSP